LSNQMKWEVGQLYSKDAVVLRGAFPSTIFSYKPKKNMKKSLGLSKKTMILNINRLDVRKRVDLLIKSFHLLQKEMKDLFLVIGGTGPEKESLRNLVKQLGIEDKVRFIGYIPENELLDYYASCDVFAHPNWADYAISPFEALALNKKIVCSNEMEFDKKNLENGNIFLADPTVEEFKKSLERAIISKTNDVDDLSNYTWTEYCSNILKELT